MRCRFVLGVALLAALVGAGCQRSNPTETETSVEAEVEQEPSTDAPTHGTPPTSSREPKTRVTDGIPVEEDYEEEAAKLITPATLEAEFAKLAAEIDPK